MNLYGSLLDSMLRCCDHTPLRRGPVYTLSMLALGIAVCLNVLSIIDLLWTFGLLTDPYHRAGALQPRRYVAALLCAIFVLNVILARMKFSADQHRLALHSGGSLIAAPVYVLLSTGLFVITLLSKP